MPTAFLQFIMELLGILHEQMGGRLPNPTNKLDYTQIFGHSDNVAQIADGSLILVQSVITAMFFLFSFFVTSQTQ